MTQDDYALIDSGEGRKLERFGPYILSRPAGQALWRPQQPLVWKNVHASFTREGQFNWERENLPEEWQISVEGIKFHLKPTDFGHLGIFPEQRPLWRWIREQSHADLNVLNLFAYSGGATLAAAQGGAKVCHLDASKGMVSWARDNAKLNKLDKAPIRWIIEDVNKFLIREIRRGTRYDGIILDPPSFGRGAKGEVFKIEGQLVQLLDHCRELLTAKSKFVVLSCHTPGLTPAGLENLLRQSLQGLKGTIDSGEMLLEGPDAFPLPSGGFARWQA